MVKLLVSRVEELEGQIKALSSNEFQELRAWPAEYDAIANRAIKDFSDGQSSEL